MKARTPLPGHPFHSFSITAISRGPSRRPPLSDQTSIYRSAAYKQSSSYLDLDRNFCANRYGLFMAKKKAAGRAWKLLKLALVWARKGGVFRRGLAPGLRLVPSYLASLRAAAAVRSDAISYGEREFSLDETPIFHFKVHRRRPRSMRLLIQIPCINPPVADDDVDDYDGIFFGRDERERNWLRWDDDANSTTEQGGRDTVVGGGGAGHLPCRSSGSEIGGDHQGATAEAAGDEEKSIDMEAEEFIAKFYEQMRLQRQISLLKYNEMLARSTG